MPLEPALPSFDALMQRADETALCGCGARAATAAPHWYRAGGPAQGGPHEDAGWALTLMDALRHDRLCIHFQRPQPLAPGERTLRIEALVRLIDATSGALIEPGRFIAPAERFQPVGQIDRWMPRHVLALLGAEPALRQRIDQVTLNLSAVAARAGPGRRDHHAAGTPPGPPLSSSASRSPIETASIASPAQARLFMQQPQRTAAASRSTISAPATPRSRTCASCPSTR